MQDYTSFNDPENIRHKQTLKVYWDQVTTMSHPSDAKRAALRSCDNIMKKIVINNLCPIELNYDTADKFLEAFLSAYERVNFDEAYILGMRFASFLRSLLLTRNNYRSSKRNLRQIETLFPSSSKHKEFFNFYYCSH